ncbi:unnamed protein product [Miscanthus lutarioriparius]|uniref:DUF4216 domain-containing protein n=1 Tax=Miscanthus lutarioriparius TaxID=422564 RepID=A0A811R367_9POAL|nr:unnamed protein product [Miscanthus lutarioriparius]
MEHLMLNGIWKEYRVCDHHGESVSDSEDSDDNMEDHDDYGLREMVNDFGNAMNANLGSFDGSSPGLQDDMTASTGPTEEASKFYRLLEEADNELYPECSTFSTLSFIVQMMNIKCLYDLSGNAMDALFTLFWKGKEIAPKPLSGAEVLSQYEKFTQNVGESLAGTLLGQEGKTKDNINSRFDMEIMGIQPKLHATPTDDGKILFHNAPYTLFGPKRKAFCEFLTKIKVPAGYSAKIFAKIGRRLIGNRYCEMEMNELNKAQAYVLKNYEEASPYTGIHKEYLRTQSTKNVDKRHEKEFFQWFKNHISTMYFKGDPSVSDELFDVARGPDTRVTHFSSYMVNGWRFNTRDRDALFQVQNSGVFVKGDEGTGNKDYFGVLIDIVELLYGTHKVVLFKCEWWDVHTTRGVKEDKYGFIMINTTRRLSTDEPYVLASQAEQVYYVNDTQDPKWYVMVKTKPRDYFDTPPTDEEDATTKSSKSSPEACQENEVITVPNPNTIEDDDTSILDTPQVEAEAEGMSVAVEGNPILHYEGDVEDEDEQQESESDDSEGGEYMDSDDEDSESEEEIDDD